MAIGVFRILIVSSILGYVLVNGRSDGGRARRGAACDDNGFDILSDLGGTPSSPPIPYDVTFIDIPDTGYIPGQTYNIRIRGDTRANRFRRFMIQGRARSDNSPVGTFGSSGRSEPQCANDTASIHTNMNPKRRVGLPWTAPPAGTGCICFKYSIVIDATTYWANLTTPCISEDLQTAIQFNASGSISEDDLTISLSASVDGVFECSLDGGSFQACSSGDVFQNLSLGSHTMNVRFTPDGYCQALMQEISLDFTIFMPTATVFSVTATATYSGTTITVTYDVSRPAMCTCQLNSMTPVPCDSGHMFTNVPNGEHSVTVACTSTENSSLMATAMVSGLQFLSVDLTLETAGTSITVIPQANIGATYRCSLDGGQFVECTPGFQFQGLSGGSHTVTVEATSLNGLTMVNVTGEITVRGSDAILITDIRTDIDISNQNYNFTFMINDKPNDLNIIILIDGSPILVPFECRRISDEMCYCTFRIPNMEYATGAHTITFQSILNGEIRGSTTSRFFVTDIAVAQFRDTAYSVVEGKRTFSVVIEKDGTNAQMVTLSVQFLAGSAMSPSDYLLQQSQGVRIPPGPSTDITVDFTINDDDIVECNETFTLSLVSLDTIRLQINPGRGQANVTIIDDDDTTVAFPGARSIIEGNTGPVEVAYLGTITQNFTITVESYQCTNGDDAATPGRDYEPVNERLTFTPATLSQTIDIMTREDSMFEGDERICLRITNLTEPCPGSVIIGNDTIVTITEDDPPVFILQYFTNTSGNSIIGRTINLFYSVVNQNLLLPNFRCALNDGNFEPCGPPPRVYGPLSYRNHTVSVKAQSVFTLEEITITHLVLMVQARLRVVNSSALQVSIQSTRRANYTCILTDCPPFSCNDGDVIADLDPMMYTLMVVADTTGNATHRSQHASDIVGPITLTGGSALSTCAGMVNLASLDGLSSYTASWRGRGDRVEFELTGEGDGWVGIGFSHNRMMAESDIILGAADASNSFVDDRYAFTRDISVQPPIDPIQNVDNPSAAFEDGVTTVMFSRLKDTGDVNDFSLSNCIYFLFAWGGDVTNITSREISYHGASRRFISDSLICIPTSTSFCPEKFDCGNLTVPPNGAIMLSDGTLEGSIATYTCSFGFRLVGNDERICQFNATWTGEIPDCV